nr:cation-translocating P-type ATPase [Clostridioides mangenotii]
MRFYELSAEEVINKFEVNLESGMSQEIVESRQTEYGKNVFAEQEKDGLMKTILRHLKDVSTIILIMAAALSFMLAIRNGHGYIEPLVIVSIVIMNLILAITQEGKAERALEALADLNSPICIVIREGIQQQIEASELVPGDVVILESGSLVPADARLIESIGLEVDESSLTGESDPSEKDPTAKLSGKTPIGDQINMLFSGCLVTAGRGTAVVTSTGMNTQIGRIAGFLGNTKHDKTPLQKRLDKVGKTISCIAIVSAVFLFAIGMRQGEDFWSMVLMAVALAVAAVPETLNLIVTLSLSHGVKNMVGKNALIRKLPAVETLGSTSVICSDKTGTLTQNQMNIKRLCMVGNEPFSDLDEFDDKQLVFLKMLALASNATVEIREDGKPQFIGNPTEIAIMRLLNKKGIKKSEIEENYHKVAEIPFSSERKMMTVVLKDPSDGYIVLTKGALDRIPLNHSKPNLDIKIKEVHDSFAEDALRVIAIGIKHIENLPSEDNIEEIEQDLDLLGMIGLIDPPRPEAAKAIETAKKAGIRTVMITGDHAATAGAIAREIGILPEGQKVLTGSQLSEMTDDELFNTVKDYSVYARVSPEDKIRIVKAWQKNGEVVAMTGDGVNDAPALKAADVGVAMGNSGTEVAKSASDIVLTDDNFATIVEAVHEGRNVYSNIRKTIYFLLVCNLSEILVMLFAQIVGWGVLVTPVMLLLINVLGDGIPGLQLAKETSDPRIMSNAPVKREESIFSGGLMKVIGRQTLICSIVVLIAYYVGMSTSFISGIDSSAMIGQTMAFLVLGLTSIMHIFTVRSRKSIFERTLSDNWPLVISAVGMMFALVLLVVIPPIGGIFGLTGIGISHWLIVIALSIVPTTVAEIGKYVDNYGLKYNRICNVK